MREPEASGKIGLGLSIASHSGLPPARIGALAEAAEQVGVVKPAAVPSS